MTNDIRIATRIYTPAGEVSGEVVEVLDRGTLPNHLKWAEEVIREPDFVKLVYQVYNREVTVEPY